MLRQGFYSVSKLTPGENSVEAKVALNGAHPIFNGHFPGHPVVPGVCMIQMLREVMEDHLDKKFRISSGDNLKFLAVINPNENREVDIRMTYSPDDPAYLVNATISSGSQTFFKFKGVFTRS